LVIGQKAVDGKSNEITAIPGLLEQLALEGAIVTLDAMGAQRTITEAILAKGADYIVALKGNQGTLHDDVTIFFKEKSVAVAWHVHADTDAGHGRIEERSCLATGDVGWLQERHTWPGLRSIIRVEAKRTDKRTGKTTAESRFYLSSLPPDPSQLLAGIRAHWSIENTLHWSMDVTFKDDLCRSRKDHAALNFAIIKHAAFNLLKQSKEAISLKNKRKKAGWDNNSLRKCLNL
jgi:predicted transposase YbfD/YdcC